MLSKLIFFQTITQLSTAYWRVYTSLPAENYFYVLFRDNDLNMMFISGLKSQTKTKHKPTTVTSDYMPLEGSFKIQRTMRKFILRNKIFLCSCKISTN